MIVYAVSDLHGNLPAVPEDAEVLLIAGDICPDFRPHGKRNHWDLIDKGGVQQGHWLGGPFYEWLTDAVPSGCEVVATWGNHDFVGEKKFLVPDLPWTLLEDQETTVRGLRVYGTAWVPGLPYWAFYGDDRRLTLRADAIPTGLDVLMTHGPPRGAGDFIPTSARQVEKYGNLHGENVGDPWMTRAVAVKRPRVTICGHIHEDRGMHAVAGQVVYNVAAVDASYVLHPNPCVRLYEL